ncbi:MAG TPA: HYR domain-containing protein, partial [Saprospiraceae bacterium]|nr:HYR domain-containing protein [Saprospiraceae bacterium]
YEYYRSAGLEDNTLFVGYAHPDHRDTMDYCPGDDVETEMFLNLYEPIWDNGENGTPVNDQNYYAKYIYLLAQKFGGDVRFWEVWNEPGFDLSGYKSWLPPGQAGNWWDNNPDPCDIIIRAPIFNYIRTMRITYEVVKSIHPNAYVVLSGVGNDSFLDAILRNTDNPEDGSVTTDFPRKGGAYYDVMGFHIYPSIDGSIRKWNNNTQSFDYFRHSDAAVDGYGERIANREILLAQYGYDGITYPKKLLTVTEMNVPRKKFGESFGSDSLQVNYILKAALYSLDNEVIQTHIFDLGERRKVVDAVGEFDLMGLYANLNNVSPYAQIINKEGIAYRTFSQLMVGATRDTALSAALNLPQGVRGGAYKRKNGENIYVLWATTTTDLSEVAVANYSFPATFPAQVYQKAWDYGETEVETLVSSQNIPLSGTPTFYTESSLNNQKLTLTCPTHQVDIVVPESDGGGIGTWDIPTVTSSCGNAQVSLVVGQESGSFFPFGTYGVGYKAVDDCGNEAHCALLIKVASNGGGQGTCHSNRYDFHFSGTFQGHNYFQSKIKATYAEAKAICENYGGYLTSIETQAENEFLQHQIFELAYIGLSDEANEGDLIWASGAPLTYGVFDTCSWCGLNTSTNDYAYFHPWDGKMSMNPGTEEQYFLMEYPCRDCDCAALNEPVCGSDSMTYANSCEAECQGVYVYDNGACVVGSEDLSEKTARFVIYPNPVEDELVVSSLETFSVPVFISFYDVMGRLLLQERITDRAQRIQVRNLPKGMIFYEVHSRDAIWAYGKLVKN